MDKVNLPVVGRVDVHIPPFFIKKNPKGWRLVNPTTASRNLSTRGGVKSLILNKDSKNVSIENHPLIDPPTLADFSVADRKRLIAYAKSKREKSAYVEPAKIPVKKRRTAAEKRWLEKGEIESDEDNSDSEDEVQHWANDLKPLRQHAKAKMVGIAPNKVMGMRAPKKTKQAILDIVDNIKEWIADNEGYSVNGVLQEGLSPAHGKELTKKITEIKGILPSGWRKWSTEKKIELIDELHKNYTRYAAFENKGKGLKECLRSMVGLSNHPPIRPRSQTYNVPPRPPRPPRPPSPPSPALPELNADSPDLTECKKLFDEVNRNPLIKFYNLTRPLQNVYCRYLKYNKTLPVYERHKFPIPIESDRVSSSGYKPSSDPIGSSSGYESSRDLSGSSSGYKPSSDSSVSSSDLSDLTDSRGSYGNGLKKISQPNNMEQTQRQAVASVVRRVYGKPRAPKKTKPEITDIIDEILEWVADSEGYSVNGVVHEGLSPAHAKELTKKITKIKGVLPSGWRKYPVDDKIKLIQFLHTSLEPRQNQVERIATPLHPVLKIKSQPTKMNLEGRGIPLADQKFSLNEAAHFFGKDVPHMFGHGTPLADQKFSLNEAAQFFKNVPHMFGHGVVIHHHHYQGTGFIDDLKNAFSPHGPIAHFVEKTVPSTLIHTGIPIAGQVLGSIAGTALAPESGPIAGMAAGAAGKMGGTMLANKIGSMTGLGVRKGRFAKGSQEAKDHMAAIRNKRKGGMIPAPPSRSYDTSGSGLYASGSGLYA